MSSLHTISKELRDYLDNIEEVTLDQFSFTEEEFKSKLENTMKYYFNLRANEFAAKEEAKRINALAKSYGKKADGIKNYISYCMNAIGLQSHESTIGKISFRKSTSVNITDASLLPKIYTNTKTTVTPDKAEIKQAISDGLTVPGAEILSNQNIQIK